MYNLNNLIESLKSNQVGIFPCDTVLGLIGRMDGSVIDRIARIKNRPVTQSFLFLIPDKNWLAQLVRMPLSPQAIQLMETYWPGPLTLVLPKSDQVSDLFTAGKPTIGIRFPQFKPLNDLLNAINEPLISTSVNRSGEPSPQTFLGVSDEIKSRVDFIVSEFEPGLSGESTIVDCTQDQPKILRQGVLLIQ